MVVMQAAVEIFEPFRRKLAQRLALPLPGRAAQSRFEPEGAAGRHYVPSPTARVAAVLVLLYLHEGEWYLPLTLRPETLPDHPGQISLPGGSVEATESLQQAALRELDEELGVPAEGIELVGLLSPLYVFGSNFLVNPLVGVLAGRPAWVPSPSEVAEVIELPLKHLLDASQHGTHTRLFDGATRSVPHIAWQEHRVWGATSMILGELIAAVREL